MMAIRCHSIDMFRPTKDEKRTHRSNERKEARFFMHGAINDRSVVELLRLQYFSIDRPMGKGEILHLETIEPAGSLNRGSIGLLS